MVRFRSSLLNRVPHRFGQGDHVDATRLVDDEDFIVAKWLRHLRKARVEECVYQGFIEFIEHRIFQAQRFTLVVRARPDGVNAVGREQDKAVAVVRHCEHQHLRHDIPQSPLTGV